MSEKQPAFQWYPKDCDTDENVRAMDDREFGFYVRLLNHSWLNKGIPSDFKRMAIIMGRTLGYVTKIWPAIAPCFDEKDGRFFNKKQEKSRKELQNNSEIKRQASRTRWDNSNKTQSVRDAYASGLHMPSTSTSNCLVVGGLKTNHPTLLPDAESSIVEAVRERFPETADSFGPRLKAKVGQIVASQNGKIKGEATDSMIVEAVRHCSKNAPHQNSAGLFLTTVPQCICTWLTQGKPGEPTKNPTFNPEDYGLTK